MHDRFFAPNFKLGVLGGGQLGRMLIQEAINLNISVHVLDPDPNAPCKDLASDFSVGKLMSEEDVYQFGRDKDVVTIEIEHVSVEGLKRLESNGIPVYPRPAMLEMVQDKGKQKEFYKDHNIETAPFQLVDSKNELEHEGFPYVLKARKGGYDGRGVAIIRNPKDLKEAFEGPYVVEQMADIDKEISVIVTRNKSGETSTFPVVELDFNPDANLVEFLYSPARITEDQSERAKKLALLVAEKSDLVGILAVELFMLKDGSIWVNEIAPRTHNSGHQSIEGNASSQFAGHLRSILNLAPGDTSIVRPSVMINLLGEPGFEGPAHFEGLDTILALPGVYPHLYGKKYTRPFRKMGHIPVTDTTLERAIDKAHHVKSKIGVISKKKQ
jgi:5-(carboxyamino)imidazole ribonucleotide synthase